MFTGLVETIGTLRRRSGSPVARALIACDYRGLVLGESISVDGACLTVDAIVDGGFECDVSSETLAKTTLGDKSIGAKLHLERATPLGGRMGGHVVLGHVDAVGEVASLDASGDAKKLTVRAPVELARFVAAKGSIAIDGVSLTVNGVRDGGGVTFDVMLVPHTLASTLLGGKRAGDRVNLEVDVLARYVARQLEVGGMKTDGAALRHASHDDAAHDDERLLQKLRASGLA